jgi:c(7)-type cytochrome triheme protein
MRHAIALIVTVTLVGSVALTAQSKRPPEKLVFQNRGGHVTFTHAAHISRERGECATCHEKLWPQSAAEPLKNSDGCKTCHHAGGRAFEMKGNCVKCHPSRGAKSG